ncbi:hypothetical protein [Streptomyces sp. NPDC051014]|uniref:hypothetical protein n=1 Tax=Streptomyces sp. NPDC051014 TaxID=3155751 RepID=UPI003403ED18
MIGTSLSAPAVDVEFQLCCDHESLDLARAGAIWGGAWIELRGEAFPEPGWNDMAVAFTGDLVDALASFMQGRKRSCRIRFYDGPFWVGLGPSGPGEVLVSRGESDKEKAQVLLSDEAVVQGVRSNASALLDACWARQWGDNPDVVRLARALKSLDGQGD